MKITLIILTLLLTSCAKEETISFHLAAPEAKPAAFERFKKEDIWFKELQDGRYEFRVEDIQRIKTIFMEEVNKIIPFGRSSGHGPEILKIIVKKLKQQNIPYKINKFEGDNWLVWEEKDHDIVQKIKKEASKELTEMMQNELN